MEPPATPAGATGGGRPDDRVTCPWCDSDQVEQVGMVGPTVMTASWILRHGVRFEDRNRFFASCWLMVEPPATLFPFFRFFS